MTEGARPGRAARQISARAVAETVLARVLEDGAFAAAALEAEIERRPQLDARDRALATTLVYGTLRAFPWLEAKLDKYAKKSVTRQRPRVRAALALGAYQVLLLDRVPPYAAVSEAVDAIREVSDAKVGGFANAILRKLAAEAEKGRPSMAEAISGSMAPWLRAALERTLGADGLQAAVALDAPPLGLCVRDEHARARWIEKLATAHPNASFEAGAVSPHAILVRGAGRPQDLAVVRAAEAYVQEQGSQLVALALGAKAGERVLDACAGRGHKTAMFAHAVAPSGAVDAADLHESKLERLRADFAKMDLHVRETFPVDWSIGCGDVAADYDAVLVDAPCSGTGTVQRRPDILLRRKETDVAELAALQVAILRNAATRVRVGGRLVYAVCSLLREEAEGVLAAAQLETLSFCEAPFAGESARKLFGDVAAGRLLPHVHGTDGYFLASFVRKS